MTWWRHDPGDPIARILRELRLARLRGRDGAADQGLCVARVRAQVRRSRPRIVVATSNADAPRRLVDFAAARGWTWIWSREPNRHGESRIYDYVRRNYAWEGGGREHPWRRVRKPRDVLVAIGSEQPTCRACAASLRRWWLACRGGAGGEDPLVVAGVPFVATDDVHEPPPPVVYAPAPAAGPTVVSVAPADSNGDPPARLPGS